MSAISQSVRSISGYGKSSLSFKYLTLDGTGTLFYLKESIGDTYLNHYRAICDPNMQDLSIVQSINKNFGRAFKNEAAKMPNFGRNTLSSLSASAWWSNVVYHSFPESLHAKIDESMDELMTSLYNHYSSSNAWQVFDDVRPTLERLQNQGIPMGVISNFDERIESILESLELRQYFSFVLSSWEHGEMKPAASIFHQAARLHGLEKSIEMLHVGDDMEKDVHGAQKAGYQGRLIERKTKHESLNHVLGL
ncbi:hypothetical protein THRCLA_06876 [Thraustotheca clavata]|uniref:Haloacid dehalogenase n=1 Tax=Thraustotheca clavata TaxID=74557 RepID=A0A1V9ZI80_9STRA|nr:hypothetical protein THRCLA_06876 [Thraustotheca clavata]